MFGEPDDKEFMALKQDPEALKDRRWASNNSIMAKVGMDYTPFMDGVIQNGEPGFFWLDNARAYSRMNGHKDHKDRRASGCNPCSEQTLESFECCCLVETFPAHHDTYADFEKTLKMAYLYAKTVTLVPTHDQRANAVMLRNRRIGCSMSGITQAIAKFGRREFLNMCDKGYGYIQELDHTYSDWLGIPLSIKTTSVKPSGSVSLLCGSTPGIHYPHSEYYTRHVRVANTSPFGAIAQKAGYEVYADPYADNTSVVAFPIKEKNFLKGKENITIWEQFINAVDMQKHWADNQVSVTLTFKPHEVKDIKICLETFDDQLKGVSLLPQLDEQNGGYAYPPYMTITQERYEAMASKITPMNFGKAVHEVDEKFCTSEKCELPIPEEKV
jgi:adenosylcobalamin-dependent ribonucleoside-triphosphate reductase